MTIDSVFYFFVIITGAVNFILLCYIIFLIFKKKEISRQILDPNFFNTIIEKNKKKLDDTVKTYNEQLKENVEKLDEILTTKINKVDNNITSLKEALPVEEIARINKEVKDLKSQIIEVNKINYNLREELKNRTAEISRKTETIKKLRNKIKEVKKEKEEVNE
jgi:vacuolar-type H+-ATPase subunit I/STV1